MNATVIRRERLRRERLGAMYALLARHFSGVTQIGFLRDLQDKHWVVLVEDDDGRLRGFTTMRVYETGVDGSRVRVVCSGDTIVDESARWNTALARGWLDTVLGLIPSDTAVRLYWLLICSGYRTYRFLPVFYREFWPRFDLPTPADVAGLMHRLATERWGGSYRPADGIVRFPSPQMLLPDAARPGEGRKRDPHVDYFLRRNSGQFRGDELVCLAPVRPDNLTAAGRRILRSVASGTERAEAAL